MDHSIIDTFLTVARTRNVGQAAEQLNLSQSAVSKRLKLLEQEIGVELFERVKGNKSFCLTSDGEGFIDVAERWLAVWRETQSFQYRGAQLSLAIGTLDSLNYALLPQLYQALSRHQPRLNLKVITAHSRELYDAVDRREVDVAFTLLRREHPNVFNPGAVALDDGLEPACVVVAVHLPPFPDGAIRQALALKGQLPDGGRLHRLQCFVDVHGAPPAQQVEGFR